MSEERWIFPRLERLLDHLDQKGIRFVMAFGDSGNDIEMLEMAGHSYAVANAEEAVKAVAKHLAPTHQEGGVYQVIEEYLGIDPLGTSERKELDGGTTVRRLALKGAGENHNNLSGT